MGIRGLEETMTGWYGTDRKHGLGVEHMNGVVDMDGDGGYDIFLKWEGGRFRNGGYYTLHQLCQNNE